MDDSGTVITVPPTALAIPIDIAEYHRLDPLVGKYEQEDWYGMPLVDQYGLVLFGAKQVVAAIFQNEERIRVDYTEVL